MQAFVYPVDRQAVQQLADDLYGASPIYDSAQERLFALLVDAAMAYTNGKQEDVTSDEAVVQREIQAAWTVQSVWENLMPDQRLDVV